nr:MAG TPA: ATP synthase [Caudoviricetes sp.]
MPRYCIFLKYILFLHINSIKFTFLNYTLYTFFIPLFFSNFIDFFCLLIYNFLNK